MTMTPRHRPDRSPVGPAGLPVGLGPAARRFFGNRLPLAIRYAELLITDGVSRGLIGPREASRIWERHLLNCAAIGELVQPGELVIDVGSGAGLPGIVLAIARPDLRVVLVESLGRRLAFLAEAVAALDLDHTRVVHARAEDLSGGRVSPPVPPGDVVTARALARLDRLTALCLPLARVGGRVLAVKGASAAVEVAACRAAIASLGGGVPVVRICGAGILDHPTTVVEIVREAAELATSRPGTGRAGSGRSAEPGPRARRGKKRARRPGGRPGGWR